MSGERIGAVEKTGELLEDIGKKTFAVGLVLLGGSVFYPRTLGLSKKLLLLGAGTWVGGKIIQ